MGFYYKFRKIFKFPIPLIFKKYLKEFYGKNQLDKKLLKYLNYNNGFYIEIGAYDGITQSNTFYLERKKNWKGILIEPSKKVFDKCIKYRSNKNYFYNRACVSFNYKNKYLKLNYSGLKTYSDKFLEKKRIKDYISNPEILYGDRTYTYNVLAVTMNSLLSKSNAPKIIDFMSLDTEGAEFEILKGINFKKYKFRYLLIESNSFVKLKKFMKKNEYDFIKKFNENDFLFKFSTIK